MAETIHEVRLKVGELTAREEAGRGIVRIDSNTMNKLGVKEGDVIEIEGSRITAAIAVRAYPADVGLNIIRMDGITRRNAGSGVGEYVKLRKADVKEAKSVTLAPAQKGIIINIAPHLIKQNIYMRPVVKGDIIIPAPAGRRRGSGLFEEYFGFDFEEFFFTPFSGETRFVVTNTNPGGVVRIGEITELEILPQLPESIGLEERAIPTVTYEDVGGIKEIIHKVREMIELPLRHPELFERLGIEPPKGVLLYGPPGTGKTLLAKAVANESGANFISISGPEIFSKWYGQTEENLRKIFEDAEKNAPSIIFIDEIDAIAPKREEVTGEVERRTVSQLLTLMDGLKKRGKVIVIAATNRPNSIDPALRRAGRFDREIEFPVPDREGRLEIFKIHTRNMPLAKDVDLNHLADITHGFVGADIWAVCKEAAMSALRRILPEIKWKEEEELPKEAMEKLVVTKEDFENALRVVEPSAMREVLVEIPKVKWSDIGGLEEVKQQLQEMVEWPLKYPQSFEKMGINPPRGILLYGPPGTGKTLLAKAVANESGANFISIKGPELLSKWVGESEKGIREIFRRAKQVAPAIIFFDEIDALAPRRGMFTGSAITETVVSQLLSEMAGLEELKGVIVMAATNRPDIVDPALLRPGRFDRLVLVPAPDYKARIEIFKVHTRNMPLAKDVDLQELARKTEGFSGADIESLCREAAMEALREDKKAKEVKIKHFESILSKMSPSITKDVMNYYEKFIERRRKVEREEKEVSPRYIG
ncbi:MAG: CDC48 family AAA ATPase [Candidatus Aenigmatarchaeota archaeon]|nr:CDC48 family AAA ATPase [Candidatus Aenigmarchaeota archaeon]